VIPTFTDDGLLPPGIHMATWEEVEARFGGTPRRQRMLVGLRRGLNDLGKAGCRRAYLDGSFVTDKKYPGDFDVCWERAGVRGVLLDPVLLDRRAQKLTYDGEFFISDVPATVSGMTYIDFFQQSRDGTPKGIIGLDL